MNLLLIDERDLVSEDRARVGGERLRHLRRVLRLAAGDRLAVGRLNGRIGTGTLLQIDDTAATMHVTFEVDPPTPLPVSLVLALPRPPVLRRLLQATAAMGVKQLFLLQTRRVEKSYWQSSSLAPEAIRRQLLLGLEQARDTLLPEVFLRRRFRPFAEDELPQLVAGRRGVVAHPQAPPLRSTQSAGETVLVVGPEGGLVPYEIERLEQAGLQSAGLGPRTLRVETAVVALLALLSPPA